MKFTGERFIPSALLLNDEIGYEHLHRYNAATVLTQNKIVLDIACGEGYGSALIAEHATSVYGVDIDVECINLATEKYESKIDNLHFKCGSADVISFDDNMFDVVISYETIEHLDIDTQELFLSEIKRVLKHDGILIMSTPDKKIYSERYAHQNDFHLHEFYQEEFTSFLKKYFRNLSLFKQGYEVVSIISNLETEGNSNIALYNLQNEDQKQIERKYLIAIASNEKLPDQLKNFSCIITKVDKDYLLIMDRLVSMNEEIEVLGKWGTSSNIELDAIRLKVDEQNESVNFYKETIKTHIESINRHEESKKSEQEIIKIFRETLSLNQETIKSLVEDKILNENTIKLLQENKKSNQEAIKLLEQNNLLQIEKVNKSLRIINEKDFLLEEYNQKIHHLYQEVNSTKERLSEIYISDGWRLLSIYYKIKGKILPENSFRYKKLKKIFNKLRPKRITKVNNNTNNSNADVSILLLNKEPLEILTLPLFADPKVSIIIPAYNAWEINYQCISSIINNTIGVAYEVILADDCSSDSTANCTDIINNIVHVRTGTNEGFLKNCNHAAKFAKGKFILFLNNDTKVTPNWLAPLVTLIESDEVIGMVGSKLIYPDGKLQEAGGIIWNDASGWNYGHKQNPELPEFNYVKEVDYISGAAILIKKDLWEKTGGFDERYSPAYFEDTDFAFTVRSMGYKVMYQPLSEVIHYEGYSHGTDEMALENPENIKYFQAINKIKFFNKWEEVLLKEHLPNAENVFNARDKTIDKKTILVIDHYVPHHDKDAGSKTTFQYLKLFVSLGLNIKFLGDNFFKHEPYTTELQQMGIEVLYGTWYNENWQQWIVNNKHLIDYIYINRPHISIKYIDFVKANTRSKILYYGHDLHFLREQIHYEITQDKKHLESSKKWEQTERYLFEKSDIILTPSDKENNIISALNSAYNVETILPFFFKEPSFPLTNFTERKQIIFVGGFTHTPNLDAVLWFCQQVWPLVINQLPIAKFVIVGSNPTTEVLSLASDTIEVKGFVSENELISLYSKSKIAVVPLRYGAGVKGKTIEAMYNGLPIVSTKFGIEGMPGNVHKIISTFDDPKEFADEIIRLYSNNDLLEQLSLKEVDYVNEYFTQKAAAKKMQSLLNLKTT